jgi:hypothetical protein
MYTAHHVIYIMSHLVPPPQINEAPSLLNPLEQQYFDCFLNTLIVDPQNTSGTFHPTPSLAFETNSSEENDKTKSRARLTPDQKRLNHLESEKRRRQCVREAFDRLINTSSYFTGDCYGSKSNLLERAARYIQSLHNDIHLLTHHLHSLNRHVIDVPQ